MNDTKKTTVIVSKSDGSLTTLPSMEVIKNEYICEGSTADELSVKYNIPAVVIKNMIEDNQLDKLRAAHIKHGLAQLQNVQLKQAEKIMTLDNQFKRMRILQIEKMLEDYMAYYSHHGHFYKIHPITGDILKDTNGIPMQIKIPNVSAEILQLKESVSLSAGLKQMLSSIDDIINKPKDVQDLDPNLIDMNSIDGMFKPKKQDDED